MSTEKKGINDMSEVESSIELYRSLAERFSYNKSALGKNDIELLLSFINRELVIISRSPLLDVAYSSCRLFFSKSHMSECSFEPTNFAFSDSGRDVKISAFDAWFIINLLSKYISKGSITEDISGLLPYFFGNYMPQNSDTGTLLDALQCIDSEIQLQREKMYSLYVSKSDDNTIKPTSSVITIVDKKRQVEATSSLVTASIEKEKETILGAARKQAEEECRRIVDDATEEGKRIIQRAVYEADNKVSLARKKHAEMLEERRKQAALVEQQLLQQGFSEVRTALVQANEMLKKLEDIISESAIKKITTQLLELFNLIADSKESAFDLARINSDQDLENAAYNMDVFLDMIAGYMAEHGIMPIASTSGEKFNSKYHATRSSNQQFDPRSAVIKTSRRIGFLWGDQVLQKEEVEI